MLIFSIFPPRAQAQGWVFTLPPNAVTIAAKRNNVFYVGEPVCLWVTSGTATNFEVRNYFGDLVDSGTITDTSIMSKVTAPGWYKVYVYGATNQGPPYGNVVGGTTFTIIRPDANFPSMPDSYEAGRYLSWNLKGHVSIQINTIQPGSNGVVNGLFFDPAVTSATAATVTAPGLSGTSIPSGGGGSASAVYVTSDADTEGNWKGVYGSDGYDVINDSESFPAYAQVTGADSPTATWAAPTSDPRALERASSSTDRIAASVYSGQSAGNSFTIDINLTDGKAHQLALYALDWDAFGPRNETIQLIDPATGNVLDTKTIGFFLSGKYLIWNVQGHIQVVVTNNVQGTNADISGLFFDPPGTAKAPAATSAQFVGPDTATQGNWQGVYGGDGYNVVGDQTSYPAYATVLPSSSSEYLWAPDTINPRALMKVSGTDRVAAALYTPPASALGIDVNLTDGQSHKVSLYAEDWGSFGPRAQTITIIDANSGAVLDTETIGATNGPYDGQVDELIRGITGMGPQRYPINDASNPDPDIVHIQSEIAVDKQVYTPYDPVRKRVLMVEFPNGTLDTAGVQTVVQTFQNDVQYYEGRNEPNYNYTGSQFVTQELESFYQTVKGVNQSLKVLGPAIVTIGPGYGLPWIQDFLNAGGANYIDGFSFHAYNNLNGDFVLADESLQGLKALLAQYNASNMEIWQTEQGAAAGLFGAYEPRLQGRWDMVQMMAYEQYGIPKEHNVLWYDVSHGFWDVPDFWENYEGSLEPAAPLMRVWSEELYGTTYSSAFDFGNPGNKMYVGDYFSGTNKNVAAFMSQGDPYGQINLTVSSGTSIHCVSAFGCESDLPVVSGSVTLPVPELPVYVELQANQTISVVPLNWGTNLATQTGVTAQASGDGLNPWDITIPNSIDKIHDGIMRDWYYGQGNNDFPWADDTKYPGSYPATVELDMPTVQTIDHVVVYANPSWELYGTLLDYDLQYDSGGQWVTIEHVTEPTNTKVVYTPYICCTCDSFFSDRWIFPLSFPPVATGKIRLLVNNVTYGGAADADLAAAGYLSGPACINLRQIEVYNASGVNLPGSGLPVTSGSTGPTTVTGSASAVTYLGTDTTNQGNWIGVYGTDGYNVIGDTVSYPAYATVTATGNTAYTWAGSTSDPRALQKASLPTDRVAGCWYTGSSYTYTVDINLTDGKTHQLAVYALDWDGFGPRQELIEIIDAASGTVLDHESASAFQKGEYFVWAVQGHVQLRVINTNPSSNAVISGLFFDPTTIGSGTTTSGSSGTTTGGTTPEAVFVKSDSATQGNWIGGYGTNGYNIIGYTTSYPSYATVTGSGESMYTWNGSTTDPRALQESGTSPNRIAACWYSGLSAGNSYTVDVNLTDGKAHQLGVYALDWDGLGRNETIQMIDPATGNVLDTEVVSSFMGGDYLTWTVQGHIQMRVVNNVQGCNAVIGGLFFDPVSTGGTTTTGTGGTTTTGTGGTTTTGTGGTMTSGSSGATSPGAGTAAAAFIGTDGTSQGSWIGEYGSDGFNIIGYTTSYPSYATVTGSADSVYTWNGSTTDPRALQESGTSPYRIAACWYTGPSAGDSYTVDVNLTDGNAHRLGVYALDWDGLGRKETIQIIDPATGTVLDTEVVSSFTGGEYLKWTVQGHIQMRVVNNIQGWNGVIGGLFFDPVSTGGTTTTGTGGTTTTGTGGTTTTGTGGTTTSGTGGTTTSGTGGTTTSGSSGAIANSAQFITLDATTQGSWAATYGSDGYNVIPAEQVYPSYATVTPLLTSTFTWTSWTSDPRALQLMNRIAACWYSAGTFTVDVNLTDGQSHRVALYALDWDGAGPRAESIQVIDAASGTVLDTESMSSFQNGKYLVWDLKGHVTIQVSNVVAGTNAVVSGLFFGMPGATPQSFPGASGAHLVNVDSTTQGNWKGIYGTDGYNVIDAAVSYPAYATVATSGAPAYAWQASTTDPRGLELSGGPVRVAGCWYTAGTGTVDIKLTEGQAHKVAMYALDWDGVGPRAERVDVIDPTTGNVLDTRTVTSFQGGQYLVWALQGHVQINFTNLTPGSNAVVNGLFFGSAGRN